MTFPDKDESAAEHQADGNLISALRAHDLDAVAKAIRDGAPFGDYARDFLAGHFAGDLPWGLKFHKRGRGAPQTKEHRDREALICMELHALAPLEKDEALGLTLAAGCFDGFIEAIKDAMLAKHGLHATRSEITKLWAVLADDLGIKQKRRKPRNPGKSR
jgi:hypothetical protein